MKSDVRCDENTGYYFFGNSVNFNLEAQPQNAGDYWIVDIDYLNSSFCQLDIFYRAAPHLVRGGIFFPGNNSWFRAERKT